MGTKHYTSARVKTSRYGGRYVNTYVNEAGHVFQAGSGFDYAEAIIPDVPDSPDCVGVGNTRQSQVFQKDCSGVPGTSGTYYEYVVNANTYFAGDLTAANALALADIAANGQTQANAHGTCIVTSNIGTLLIDYYNDVEGDICFYCHTVGVAETDIPVTARANNGGTGVARYPNDGRDPATCYLLSSDRLLMSGSVAMRFGVNMAYFISTYPGIDHFTFIMRGRSSTGGAGVTTGIYALRNISEGYLAMVAASGEPSKFIPTVIGASPSGILSYSTNTVSGGDGTTGVSVGSPILQLDYVVSTNTLTKTTY